MMTKTEKYLVQFRVTADLYVEVEAASSEMAVDIASNKVIEKGIDAGELENIYSEYIDYEQS